MIIVLLRFDLSGLTIFLNMYWIVIVVLWLYHKESVLLCGCYYIWFLYEVFDELDYNMNVSLLSSNRKSNVMHFDLLGTVYFYNLAISNKCITKIYCGFYF